MKFNELDRHGLNLGLSPNMKPEISENCVCSALSHPMSIDVYKICPFCLSSPAPCFKRLSYRRNNHFTAFNAKMQYKPGYYQEEGATALLLTP